MKPVDRQNPTDEDVIAANLAVEILRTATSMLIEQKTPRDAWEEVFIKAVLYAIDRGETLSPNTPTLRDLITAAEALIKARSQ